MDIATKEWKESIWNKVLKPTFKWIGVACGATVCCCLFMGGVIGVMCLYPLFGILWFLSLGHLDLVAWLTKQLNEGLGTSLLRLVLWVPLLKGEK